MKKSIACSVLVVFACTIALAQNAPPPRGTASLDRMITIDYGRPALKGRTIEDLFKQLPPDRVWRAGQNQVTTLTVQQDILVGGQKVAAGKYSVYVHVAPTGEWSLLVNQNLGQELSQIFPKAPPKMAHEMWPYYTNYTEKIGKEEVARVPMKSEKLSAPVDPFTIELIPNKGGGTLRMAWGGRAASVSIAPAK